jgi:hypothetical protein
MIGRVLCWLGIHRWSDWFSLRMNGEPEFKLCVRPRCPAVFDNEGIHAAK